MNCRRITIFGGCVICCGAAAGSSVAFAQSTFQNYRCADGTQFIVGFFQYDSRAHLQLDGKAVTLAKRAGAVRLALFRQRRDPEDHEGRRHHAQARQTAGHGMRADMKKGRNDFVSTLFYCPTAPEGSRTRPCQTSGRHQWSRSGLASSMAAAWYQLSLQVSAVDRRGGGVGCGPGLAIATSPESRAAPGRELVDLGRPLIHTRIHHQSLLPSRRDHDGAPDSFSCGYRNRDIVCARRGCKLLKKSHWMYHFVGIFRIASCEAMSR